MSGKFRPAEWRNDFSAVSNINSVKLNSPWRCGVRVVRRKDPVHLYCNFTLVLGKNIFSIGGRHGSKGVSFCESTVKYLFCFSWYLTDYRIRCQDIVWWVVWLGRSLIVTEACEGKPEPEIVRRVQWHKLAWLWDWQVEQSRKTVIAIRWFWVEGPSSTDKRYAGDNRLILPKSSYRRQCLAPRCRLITSWGWSRSWVGCSPIKVVRAGFRTSRQFGPYLLCV